MPQQIDLHKAAREIFALALSAADPRQAIRQSVSLDGSVLRIAETDFDISSRQIYVVALGKAAAAMSSGLSETLGDKITRGVITTSPPPAAEPFLDPTRWKRFAGGHPLPNQQSLDAAQAAFQLLHDADAEQALVIFLVSGGGSAMIEWPRNKQITLDELRAANRRLVSCGATIAEVNAVRRSFSAVKGGGLAAVAPGAEQITLIVSDTNPGDEVNVASGPSLKPPANAAGASEVVARYRLDSSLPEAILKALREYESARPLQLGVMHSQHYVLLDNKSAIDAASARARQIGFKVAVADEIREQPIAEGCGLLVTLLKELFEGQQKREQPVCLVSGGEFSCSVAGNGTGGRNLETVLRCAILLAEGENSRPRHSVVLSAGSDGIDGNSPAAGAVADEITVARGRFLGLDARNFLERSDSFTFFQKLDDTLTIGPTGTNVRDIRLLLAGSSTRENQ